MRRGPGVAAMTDAFRRLALALPEASEQEHQGHPDLRVAGKVFASLGPEGDWAMVKLSLAEQAARIEAEPEVFEPFAGAWGRAGCTRVELALVEPAVLAEIVRAAWRNVAPPALVARHEAGD